MPESSSVRGERVASEHVRWQPWATMADLAEAVDDLICSFDYMDTAMDNLVMVAFIWILVSIGVLGLAKWAYRKYKTDQPKLTSDRKTSSEIVTSSDGVLATSAKVKSSSLKATKPTGFVPATPPNKKRTSRMSPGPEHLSLKKTHAVPVPSCTGADPPSVQWVNELLAWLYHDLVVVGELVQQWIASMNEFSKKSVEEQGIGVELVRALESHPPSITNVFCECDTKDDVTITCDCDATPAFQLKAFSQRGEKVAVSHYRLNVNRFRARLHVLCVTDKLTGELRCDGWPEVKVALAPVGPLKPNTSENNLQQLVSDIVVSALRNTEFAFSLAQYPTCPRLRRHADVAPRLPLHYDSMLHNDRHLFTSTPISSSASTANVNQLGGDKRLLVKVVSARDLGGKSGCIAPYCVVEMDEPPQRNQTGFKRDTNSPVWEEHFLFELSPQTAELLFEVYDRSGPPSPGGGVSNNRFLGLGLVGIDELLAAPSQRQQIALQPRPMEQHDVSGTLTVEFLFIEGAEIPELGSKPFKVKESLRAVTPHGLTTTTKTTFQQNGSYNNPRLTESALRELELNSSTAANKSTLIIHSVQREPKKHIKVEIKGNGTLAELDDKKEDETEKEVNAKDSEDRRVDALDSAETGQNPHKSVRINENGEHKNEQGDYAQKSTELSLPETTPRKRKRDFFGTIKRRLGRSRTRGQSLDPPSVTDNQNHLRSISAERNGHENSMQSRSAYSAGTSPVQSGDESRTSRRSSVSEMSAVSGASGRTYVHEASTLVLETLEAGVKRHYLVPLTMAQRSKWRRKGVKLHIYNEHTFVAKHLSGGVSCAACGRPVARRLGKQGYECRDCSLRCHKHCHVNVTAPCPNSAVRDMDLWRAADAAESPTAPTSSYRCSRSNSPTENTCSMFRVLFFVTSSSLLTRLFFKIIC